jgi:hypothetical protein
VRKKSKKQKDRGQSELPVMASAPPPDPALFPPQTVFDYHRTVVGYHGTRKKTAERLVDGEPFGDSVNDDDWLGHGVYFWEYAPLQAWRWAEDRYGKDAAVVGATLRLGRCLDLLDPMNVELLKIAHARLEKRLAEIDQPLPNNANKHKYLDCAVFNFLFAKLDEQGHRYETCRAVFVPMRADGGMARVWKRSGVFEGGHIQINLREPRNILAAWSVRRDGRYGSDK